MGKSHAFAHFFLSPTELMLTEFHLCRFLMQDRDPDQADAPLDHAPPARVALRVELPRQDRDHSAKAPAYSTTDSGNRVGPRSHNRGHLCPHHKSDPASRAGSSNH